MEAGDLYLVLGVVTIVIPQDHEGGRSVPWSGCPLQIKKRSFDACNFSFVERGQNVSLRYTDQRLYFLFLKW